MPKPSIYLEQKRNLRYYKKLSHKIRCSILMKTYLLFILYLSIFILSSGCSKEDQNQEKKGNYCEESLNKNVNYENSNESLKIKNLFDQIGSSFSRQDPTDGLRKIGKITPNF